MTKHEKTEKVPKKDKETSKPKKKEKLKTVEQKYEPFEEIDPENFIVLMQLERKQKLARILLRIKRYAFLQNLILQENCLCWTKFDEWKTQSHLTKNFDFEQRPIAKNPTNIQQVLDSMSCNQKRHLLSFLILSKQWETCNKILADESVKTRELFEKWKEETFKKEQRCSEMFTKPPKNKEVDYKDSDTEPMDEVPSNLFKNFEKETNILVLGESGVGKTTFLNALANYLRSRTIDEAKKNYIFLSKIRFTLTDDDLNTRTVCAKPTIELSEEDKKNEMFINNVIGMSVTQKPNSYKFSIGPKDEKKTIRFIDTPGMGDVRGTSTDQINIANIMKALSEHYDIKAILILLNSTSDETLSIHFKYCLNELLRLFPNTAKDNILFCFTKVRDNNFGLGGSFVALSKHLENQRNENPSMKLTLNPSNVFKFENDCFRYVCALTDGVQFPKKNIEMYNQSWRTSVGETFRLFGKISSTSTHSIKETYILFQINRTLTAFARPLVDITQKSQINSSLLENAIKDLERGKLEGKQIPKYYTKLEQELIKFEKPRTVCNNTKCRKLKITKSNATEQGNQEVFLRNVCHEDCYLDYVKVRLGQYKKSTCQHGNDALKHCHMFGNDGAGNLCRDCDCSWQQHIHEMHEIRCKIVKVENPDYAQSQSDNEKRIESLKEEIESRTFEKYKTIKEANRIKELCTDFALFLKKHQLGGFNKEYTTYLEQQIELAKTNDKYNMLEDLTSMLETHRAQLRLQNTDDVNRRSVKSTNEIYQDIVRLKADFPDILAGIEEIESLKKSESPDKSHEIPLQGSLFSSIFD